MLTCKHWDKFIDDYLAGRLGRVKSFIFRVHMTLCPPCKRYLDEYQRTLDAAHRAAEIDPASLAPLPPALAESITKCMCEAEKSQTK